MDDERTHSAHARGLLKLVRPAAVVGERPAGEELRIIRRRVADDAEDDLAFDVHTGVVIPAILWRGDAVADEDDRRIQRADRRERLVGGRIVVAELQQQRCATGWQQLEVRLRRYRLHADEVDLLQIGAVIATGLQSHERELRCNVLGCKLAAAQTGIAALEEVVG
jgi:hypothetical protein